ncbi:hypothetical protein J416_02169 [Gracilibacillus halophilus YIM-C55.5]|uniref:DUF2798 domain-containing protein n=1 Tax=Gracilibacillus halophilus YIM-C55.5 TaxID=1308866 RepID=N4WY79_9BACI|nr:hypothetical protein [Gracilibacillus halophilus]ENH98011.1 hypothetical protein J416_02169 [Gracilibacillus halophilus YIM-C55.5]
MPTNKKESFIFGLMMCSGMVAVMASYNLFVIGTVEELTFHTVLIEVMCGFVLALLLDLFVVGPLAKKITFALPFDKSKKLLVVLNISAFMILGMVFFMSLFGLVMTYVGQGLSEYSMLGMYGTIFIKNFILALPLQLLVMGPLVRFVFTNVIQKNKAVVH